MHELPPMLVAEDSDDDFFFLRRAIRAAGIEHPVLRFRDGSELVRFLEGLPPGDHDAFEHEPWLLLVDITMPIMNGFEVLEWLAQRKHGVRLRPVVLSGSYREDDIRRARALGASDYVLKPISAATLGLLASHAPAAGRA